MPADWIFNIESEEESEMIEWTEYAVKQPELKEVRNQLTGELIGRSSNFCVVYGENCLTVDYYMEWDLQFIQNNSNQILKNGWINANFKVEYWSEANKPGA